MAKLEAVGKATAIDAVEEALCMAMRGPMANGVSVARVVVDRLEYGWLALGRQTEPARDACATEDGSTAARLERLEKAVIQLQSAAIDARQDVLDNMARD